MSEEGKTLSSCFAEAEAGRIKLEKPVDSNSKIFQETLISTLAKYQECVEIASDVSLFSPNETLEDVSSRNLQYFGIHFHIAELTLRRNTEDRKATLLTSVDELERFLKLVDSYDMLTKENSKLYERYLEDKKGFSTASTTDAALRRHTKISRFREEKALKQKLENLRRDPSALEDSDEFLRNLLLTEISFYIHQSFQTLESIALEMQMLARAPITQPMNGNQDTDARSRSAEKETYSERLDAPLSQSWKNGPLLSKDGRPMRPFTLLDNRERLRDGVFQPDYNLPTMTIDEYLEEERKRGGIIEGGGEQSARKPQIDEDNMEAADRETMKARYWDEFKEENPRGSGNTMNMG